MSFLTYDTADDIITSLEIIEKLLSPENDFWLNNYLKRNEFDPFLKRIITCDEKCIVKAWLGINVTSTI